jgi:hypothetical protein
MRLQAFLLQSPSEVVVEENTAKGKTERSRVSILYELSASLGDGKMCFGSSVAHDR